MLQKNPYGSDRSGLTKAISVEYGMPRPPKGGVLGRQTRHWKVANGLFDVEAEFDVIEDGGRYDIQSIERRSSAYLYQECALPCARLV